MNAPAKLELAGLGKRFESTAAVRDVNLSIAPGEFVTLLGPSGCGKTTTLRMIAGLVRPTSGTVRLNGEMISDALSNTFAPPEARQMGMVFQSYAVWPHMSVLENVAYPLRIRRKRPSRSQITERAMNAIALVKLTGLEKRNPQQLSGGQQQRVALARALVMEPQVLLLDEPLSNLDAKLRETMRFEIMELQQRLGITVVYVTHDQAEAMSTSNRVVVMREGRVLQIGSPREVYDAPVDRFVADFIGLTNFLPCRVVTQQGETAQVRLDCAPDTLVMCHAPQGHLPDQAVLMVRPEQVELRPPAEGMLKGSVLRQTFLGDRADYLLQVGSGELRVQTGAESQFAIGQSVGVIVKRSRLLVQ